MATVTTLGYDDLPELLTRLTGDEKHDWSSLSTLDVLWVLYDRVLGPDDRFLLSKGHGPTAYYAVLAAKGLIPLEALDGFGGVRLSARPPPRPGARARRRDLERLARARAADRGRRRARRAGASYCLVGDGELDEGSNWEAVQWAGRIGLAALTTVVVDNHSSTYHWPGGVEKRFELEGWTSARVDGRDHDALERAFGARTAAAPHAVVAEVLR